MNQNTQPQRLVSPLVQHFLDNKMCRNYTGVEGEKCQLVYLQFPTQNYQQSYYFAPQTMLDGDNAIITAIEVIPDNSEAAGAEGGFSTLPSGQTNFPTSYFDRAVLYMSNLRREIIAELPLSILNRSANSAKPCFTWFQDQVWQNCYVQLVSNTFPPDQPLAFNVWYVEKQKN